MKFTQYNELPIWHSYIDASGIDLTKESIIKDSNRQAKNALSITDPASVKLSTYLNSPEFKKNVIDTIKGYKFINQLYPDNILEMLDRCTTLTFSFYKQSYDKHHLHLDHRTSVAQGIIYFDETNTSGHATRVYPNYPDTSSKIESNTAKGNGILMLNTQNTWHEGGNLISDDRYFLLYCLELKILV